MTKFIVIKELSSLELEKLFKSLLIFVISRLFFSASACRFFELILPQIGWLFFPLRSALGIFFPLSFGELWLL